METEAWLVMTNSLKHNVEQSKKGVNLRGMSSETTRERHLLTLLAMWGMDLFKFNKLNTYSGTTLSIMTERKRPYSGDEMDHFLLSCVRTGWSESLTADAARWATQLWAETRDDPAYLYWDWHVKAVYSDYHVPRTKHGTSKRIVGARKQLMLHDKNGHLLLLRTHRGDTHLIDGMMDGRAYYEGLDASHRLTHEIFDREGLSVAYLKELIGDEGGERSFTTCLRSNQYQGLDSFDSISSFQPFRYDKHGNTVREIAEATYEMKDRRSGEDNLMLRAILLRKPVSADDESNLQDHQSNQNVIDDKNGEDDDEIRLHIIITHERDVAAVKVAERYLARHPTQENAIRDWWLPCAWAQDQAPLGGDVNIGYDKRIVENSELAKVEDKLKNRLERLEQYIPACENRLKYAQQRHQKHSECFQTALKNAEQKIQAEIQQRGARGDVALDIYFWAKAEEGCVKEQLEPLCTHVETAAATVEMERGKQQRYCKEQREKKQKLTKITQAMKDRPMYELDDRKDQLASALRVFLVNALQWLRDTVFPESYANATYKTLAPFLQMGGFVLEHPECIEVRLDGFWHSPKQRDLEFMVARCNAIQFSAPDGRPLHFSICPEPGHI